MESNVENLTDKTLFQYNIGKFSPVLFAAIIHFNKGGFNSSELITSQSKRNDDFHVFGQDDIDKFNKEMKYFGFSDEYNLENINFYAYAQEVLIKNKKINELLTLLSSNTEFQKIISLFTPRPRKERNLEVDDTKTFTYKFTPISNGEFSYLFFFANPSIFSSTSIGEVGLGAFLYQFMRFGVNKYSGGDLDIDDNCICCCQSKEWLEILESDINKHLMPFLIEKSPSFISQETTPASPILTPFDLILMMDFILFTQRDNHFKSRCFRKIDKALAKNKGLMYQKRNDLTKTSSKKFFETQEWNNFLHDFLLKNVNFNDEEKLYISDNKESFIDKMKRYICERYDVLEDQSFFDSFMRKGSFSSRSKMKNSFWKEVRIALFGNRL